MTDKLEAKSKERKEDLINILILICIASVIGIYLICKTVLISKDGVFYIERAQQFSNDPIGIIRGHPFGYPFMIFVSHKFATLFSNSSSPYLWVYSAQAVTLFCRILALVPLYFIGKILVGSRNSFLALLILVFLPYPAEFGSDALRDWPNIFFLACGFWAILWGAKYRSWWVFGLAGLSSGLGYTIREACIQLVIYGIIWLIYSFFQEVRKWGKVKILLAFALLIVGFLIPFAPYSSVKGEILPDRFRFIIKSFFSNTEPAKESNEDPDNYALTIRYSAGVSTKIVEATEKLIEKTSANLMWFFVLPLFVGIYYHFKTFAIKEEKLLMISFVIFNIVFLFLRYCCVNPDLTHRYILPLTVFTIFYIPTGLKLISCKIAQIIHKNTLEVSLDKSQKVFCILIIIGICICLPKLFRPIRIKKQAYLSTAKWLNENTNREDIIAVSDRRIAFYAERKGLFYDKEVPEGARYVVKIMRDENKEQNLDNSAQQVYSEYVDRQEMKKRIVIYKWTD